MGLLVLIFGNKKEKERLERERQKEQERLRLAEEQKIAEERERRLAENRRKEEERLARIKVEKEEVERQNSIEPFVYESNIHQRYENSNPVRGLQECLRTISVEKTRMDVLDINWNLGYRMTLSRLLMTDTRKSRSYWPVSFLYQTGTESSKAN